MQSSGAGQRLRSSTRRGAGAEQHFMRVRGWRARRSRRKGHSRQARSGAPAVTGPLRRRPATDSTTTNGTQLSVPQQRSWAGVGRRAGIAAGANTDARRPRPAELARAGKEWAVVTAARERRFGARRGQAAGGAAIRSAGQGRGRASDAAAVASADATWPATGQPRHGPAAPAPARAS